MEDKAFVSLDRYIELLEIEKKYKKLEEEMKQLNNFLLNTKYVDIYKEFEIWKQRERKSTMIDLSKIKP